MPANKTTRVPRGMTLVTPVQPPDEVPPTLGAAGTDLWNRVMSEYRITDCGGREILHQICAASDRLAAISGRITEDGEVIQTKSGPKSHPSIRDEIQLRALIGRLIRSLGLNFEAVHPGVGRPARGY